MEEQRRIEKRTDALLGGKLREMALSCIFCQGEGRGILALYEFTVDYGRFKLLLATRSQKCFWRGSETVIGAVVV